MAGAAAILVPALVPFAIELIRIAGQLIAAHRAAGGTITEEERSQLWSEHASITGSIVAASPVPEPPG